MKEVEKCPNCGYYGPMESVGRMGTLKRRYICPKCRYQFTL